MVRTTLTVLLVGIVGAAGCSHFVESRAISRFTAALEKQDLDKLKSFASSEFEQKALRRDDALDAMKILKLRPEQKVDILKVEDVSEDEKQVTVTVGESKQKMRYSLVRDKDHGKWVVDDVLVLKKSADFTAAKSVTEQMDLLLAVQDFLAAAHASDRAAIRDVSTPAFAALVADLPKTHLSRLTKKIAGERIRSEEFRPEAQIDGANAVVKLQRTKGVLMLVMKQTNKGWKVADVIVESRKESEQVASAMRMAVVVRTVADFLKAYSKDDKAALQKLAPQKFYNECLKVADLSLIPLPAADVLGEQDVIKTHAKGAEYLIKRGNETVRLSMVRASVSSDDATADTYQVDDVTIYDSKQEKRISALFTAQAKVHLFVKAVQQGSKTLIRENASNDFMTKVWDALGPVKIADVLPPEFELSPPAIISTDFHGAVVRIHVQQGSHELTYLMRVWGGEVNVDDVLLPVVDRPRSMKDTMQSLLPVRLAAVALKEASLTADDHHRQIERLKTVCSSDFNRLVWTQFTVVPESAFMALPHLDAPLASIKDTETGQTVTLGDERFGARIELTRERSLLRVDRLLLVAGNAGEEAEVKHLLKTQLATRGPRGLAIDPFSTKPIPTEPPQTADANGDEAKPAAGVVIPAAHAEPQDEPEQQVEPKVKPAAAARTKPAALRSMSDKTPARQQKKAAK